LRSLAITALVLLGGLLFPLRASGPWMDSSMGLLQAELTARFGPGQRPRIQRGLAQVARYWQPRDGGAGAFEAFVRDRFAGAPAALDALLARLEGAAAGPGPSAWDPSGGRLAFTVLLNFPLASPQERIRDGGAWTARQWAEARLAEPFAARVPAPVERAVAAAAAAWDRPGSQPERCRLLLGTFQAARQLDPYCPLAPTQISRSLDWELQLPEARARELLEAVAGSPLAARAAGLLRARLGRSLEPADLRSGGFRPGGPDLDARVRARYPTGAAYARDLPRLLARLGFPPGLALASGVPPGPGALDGRGLRLAQRETGRAAAQALACRGAPFPVLAGLPGPAFGEALAQVFQERAQESLGLAPGALAALDGFWSAYAGAGEALVDLAVWHWLYQHPGAGAADLEAAVAASARGVWNRLYAPVLGGRDCELLADCGPLPGSRLDRPIGHLAAAQLLRSLDRGGTLGGAWARWARLGRLTPDLWMARATGSPLGPGPLLDSAAAALKALENGKGPLTRNQAGAKFRTF
jgi:hypothetical protein